MVVIVNKGNKPEPIELDTFIKEYGITPKCQGEYFYVVSQQDRDYYINKFPNKACAFLEGRIQYIIYKGNVQMIINNHVVPSWEYVEEEQVCNSEDECKQLIKEIEDSHRGESWIDTPNGQRIMLGKMDVNP